MSHQEQSGAGLLFLQVDVLAFELGEILKKDQWEILKGHSDPWARTLQLRPKTGKGFTLKGLGLGSNR
jgi:hypothetical protein